MKDRTSRKIRGIPAEMLEELVGLVSYPGDALEDTENIWEDRDLPEFEGFSNKEKTFLESRS